MTSTDLTVLLPLIILGASSVVVLLAISFYRSHGVAFLLTFFAHVFSFVSLRTTASFAPHEIAPLLVLDHYAVFYLGLVIAASFVVTILSFVYQRRRSGFREEFYVLLLLATLGAGVLVASTHFVALFLGLETLTIALYGMIAYQRTAERALEAGVKYLVLAAASSAFLLFGMALIYAELGTMEFGKIAEYLSEGEGIREIFLLIGTAMMIVGVGFKLAVVPFHMWTPDIYEGASAPVTAYLATVSKGAIFAVVLRYFVGLDMLEYGPVMLVFSWVAIASMFVGNILALLQRNLKRLLAYSSIAHLGYVLVAFLAGGALAVEAVTFYLLAYFITSLGAFGAIALMSGAEEEAESIDDYAGLFWRKPLMAGFLTAMLFSLAGIPLTAGFIGKFLVVTAGVGSALWLLVLLLVVNSAIGIYYYLRVIIAMYSPRAESAPPARFAPSLSLAGSVVLAALFFALVWLGVYPGPVLRMINDIVPGLFTIL